MALQIKPINNLQDEVKRFIFEWHHFPLDCWWRKKYNIPFGSRKHREMNFIDMYIEYQEGLLLIEEKYDDTDNYDTEINEKIVPMSKQEIDDDYDNLDLTNFDK